MEGINSFPFTKEPNSNSTPDQLRMEICKNF